MTEAPCSSVSTRYLNGHVYLEGIAAPAQNDFVMAVVSFRAPSPGVATPVLARDRTANRSGTATNGPAPTFDLDDNGRIDVADAVRLPAVPDRAPPIALSARRRIYAHRQSRCGRCSSSSSSSPGSPRAPISSAPGAPAPSSTRPGTSSGTSTRPASSTSRSPTSSRRTSTRTSSRGTWSSPRPRAPRSAHRPSGRCAFEHVAVGDDSHFDVEELRDRRARHAGPHARRRDLRGHGHGPRRRAGRGLHGRRPLRRRRRPARPLPRPGGELASALYDSLHEKVLSLPDGCLVLPSHGAGSLCGRAMGAMRFSTIGTSAGYNAALRHESREEFIASLTGNMPPAPDHFSRCSEINRRGPARIRTLPELRPMRPAEFRERAQREDTVVLMCRDYATFGGAHVPGSYHVDIAMNFSTYAGWVLPSDKDILLVADTPAQAREAVVRLRRVGLDRAVGYLVGGTYAWAIAGYPIDRVPQALAVRGAHNGRGRGRARRRPVPRRVRGAAHRGRGQHPGPGPPNAPPRAPGRPAARGDVPDRAALEPRLQPAQAGRRGRGSQRGRRLHGVHGGRVFADGAPSTSRARRPRTTSSTSRGSRERRFPVRARETGA